MRNGRSRPARDVLGSGIAPVESSGPRMDSQSPRLTRTPVIWVAYAAPTVLTFILSLIGPLLPHLRAELSLGYAQAALHTSAFAAGMMAMGLVGDRVARVLGRRRTFWLGIGGLAVGLTLVGLAPGLWASVLGCLVAGVLGTLLLVVGPALIAETNPALHGVLFAEQNVIAYLGALIAPPCVWLVVQLSGWRTVLVAGWITLAVCVALFGRVRLPPPRAVSGTGAGRLPPSYWAFWVLLVVGVSTEFSMSVWGPAYLETELGLSRDTAVLGVAAFPLGVIASRIAGVALLHRHSPSSLTLPSLALAFLGFMLFWRGGGVWAGLLGLFGTGLGVGNLFAISMAMGVAAAGPATAAATARVPLASGLAIIAAPLVLGALADRYGIALAYAVVPFLLAAGVLAYSLGRGGLPPLSRAVQPVPAPVRAASDVGRDLR
jgi:fucose permease